MRLTCRSSSSSSRSSTAVEAAWVGAPRASVAARQIVARDLAHPLDQAARARGHLLAQPSGGAPGDVRGEIAVALELGERADECDEAAPVGGLPTPRLELADTSSTRVFTRPSMISSSRTIGLGELAVTGEQRVRGAGDRLADERPDRTTLASKSASKVGRGDWGGVTSGGAGSRKSRRGATSADVRPPVRSVCRTVAPHVAAQKGGRMAMHRDRGRSRGCSSGPPSPWDHRAARAGGTGCAGWPWRRAVEEELDADARRPRPAPG